MKLRYETKFKHPGNWPRPRKSVQFAAKVGVEGWIRLEVRKEGTDELVHDTGFFRNMITNQGLNAIATTDNFMSWFHVGTDGTAPSASDTWLYSWVASLDTTHTSAYGCAPSAPYYGWKRVKKRFAAGVATGNLSECGVGWSSTSGTLFARSQIKDSGGTPKTITVLADEYLDFTYELRYYPPATDTVGTIVIDGDTYDYTVRALAVTSTFYWAQYIGNVFTYLNASESYHRAYTGGLNTVDAGSPLGTDATGTTSLAKSGYSADSHYLDFTVSATTSQWNVSGGLAKSFVFGGKGCRFQAQFEKQSDSTGIPKTSLITLMIHWRISWDRT